ncbi:MAG: xanthine dehydrogenase family protein subunit M [Gammaproteobacteria bacterium]|nr:xanthine dehydrogenase family protein subunit M [Gammaproteobacteria bacterium]
MLTYNKPTTVDEAVILLQQPQHAARALAGGTDLLVELRSGRLAAQGIVDLKRIPELRALRAEQDGFRIGAAVSGAELGEHATLKAMWPGVVEAANLIGSTQIQGRASLGGNLCNASPAADSVPALIAAGARCTVAGPGGRREVPVESIVTGPGKTSLVSGEFVVDFVLPAQAARGGDAYLRFIPRTEMDIAVVGVAVNLTLDAAGVCTTARVAVGAVAPTARLVDAAGAALVGTTVDETALNALMAAVRAACAPINDKRGTIEFRTHVAGVLAGRAAKIALDRARSRA